MCLREHVVMVLVESLICDLDSSEHKRELPYSKEARCRVGNEGKLVPTREEEHAMREVL